MFTSSYDINQFIFVNSFGVLSLDLEKYVLQIISPTHTVSLAAPDLEILGR